MSDLTLRETKGSPLTHQELDKNITHVNPVGTVITFAGATPPPYYLECDGQEISRTEYSNLFNVLGELYGAGDGVNTFNLPDLRGEFIRGWDNSRGIDSGREMGSFQEATGINQTVADSWYIKFENTDSNIPTSNQRHISSSNFNTRTDNKTITTRPRNIAMMYCIKY